MMEGGLVKLVRLPPVLHIKDLLVRYYILFFRQLYQVLPVLFQTPDFQIASTAWRIMTTIQFLLG